jgi:indolepyruvate ferredoxin oxidoreductase beta subunit
MGRLAKHLSIPVESWKSAIRQVVAPKFIEINEKAFELGYNS